MWCQLLTRVFVLSFLSCSSGFLLSRAVIVSGQVVEENYPYFLGFAHLASGLSNGLSGLAAGICIGIVGDAGVRATGQNVRCSWVCSMVALAWNDSPILCARARVPLSCYCTFLSTIYG